MPITNKSEAFPNSRRGDGIKKLARNTWRYTDSDGASVVRLHRTDIVRALPNGKTILNSGGWRSKTTKDRMQDYAPGGVHIYQSDGIWYVSNGDWQQRSNGTAITVPYYDGIVLPDAFKGHGKTHAEKEKAKQVALLKRIGKYCRAINKLEKLPLPDAGDCWYCSMFQAEKPVARHTGCMGHARDVGQSGPVTESEADHLLGHMDEGYIHGSLLVNAMRWAGMQDVGISYYLNDRDKRMRRYVVGHVRRYLKRKLGVG